MGYHFTEKRNNRQQQMGYILLMIIGSYFHKSICNTKAMETTLFLHYKELSENRQINLEERVIKDTERMLSDYLPIFTEMNCEISICRNGEYLILIFETGLEFITAEIDTKGNYRIRIQCHEAA